MSIDEALELANEQLAIHGLVAEGWRVKMYMNTDRMVGQCNYSKKLIRLHRLGVYLNTREHVLDTILHEIAHALTPYQMHGPKWKAKAVELGATPTICVGEDFKMPPKHDAVNRSAPRLVKRTKVNGSGNIPEIGGE